MTTMRLSYVPIPESHHVYLNGLEMQEGTDWSDDGTGLLTFLGPMAEVSGDKIEVLYAHEEEVFDPYAGWLDYPIDVRVQYETSLSRDYWSCSFDTVNGLTPADGWGWRGQCGYVDGGGTLVYDGNVYPTRLFTYNSGNGRWELVTSQSPYIHSSINRVYLTSGGLNLPGHASPEWVFTTVPVQVGGVF